MFEEKNQIKIEELSKHIKANQVIPFIGAGISCPIYPTWKEYLEQMAYPDDEEAAQYIQQAFNNGPQNYEDIAQYFYDRYPVEFINETKRIFTSEKISLAKINRVALAIPKLFAGPMITTNLDQTIEWVYQKYDIPLSIGLPNETGFFCERLSDFRPSLWKIHGDIDKTDSWVLTSDNYACQYSKNSVKFLELLYSVLQYKKLLFLGSSLQSDKIVFLLRELYKKNRNICHYAILPAPDERSVFYNERSRVANLGVEAIWYENGNYSALEKIVRELEKNSGKNKETLCSLEREHRVSGFSPKCQTEMREIEITENVDENKGIFGLKKKQGGLRECLEAGLNQPYVTVPDNEAISEDNNSMNNSNKKIQGYRISTIVKKGLIQEAKKVYELCPYDDSYFTEQCKKDMQQLQQKWKMAGHAGYEEEHLWEEFHAIQDRFFGRIKLRDLDTKIANLTDKQYELDSDYEIAQYERKWGLANSLADRIDDLEYKIQDLLNEKSAIEEKLSDLY